ncbi:MAG TPA: TIGR02206 family membrane protein [Anaerolineales bacterium]|nr:TIGR02206 family membrane protein [Anaerolineales bacterium]
MEKYFTKDYAGESFRHFQAPHLAALGLILLLSLSFPFLRQSAASTLTIIRMVMAAALVLNELSWHGWNWRTGQWTIQTLLPLHLCGLMVWSSALMLVTRSYTLYEYLYFLGMGAASQALLTPDLGKYGFPHFRYFQTFISHGLIFTAPIYMTVVEGYRPYWESILRVAVGVNVYMLVVGVINWRLGSNYMFIARKPDTPSLIDYLGPWPWYILSMEAIGLLLSLLLYLPFAIGDRLNL